MAGFVLTSKDTHMKYVLTSLLIVFLAACGGGSAGPGMASSPTSALVAQLFECVSVMPSGNILFNFGNSTVYVDNYNL